MLIRKEGDALVLIPARTTWTPCAEDTLPVGDDFLAERADLMGDAGHFAW